MAAQLLGLVDILDLGGMMPDSFRCVVVCSGVAIVRRCVVENERRWHSQLRIHQ